MKGLAAITPAAGYVNVQVAMLVGLVAGLTAWLTVVLVRHKLDIDDALDVRYVSVLSPFSFSLMPAPSFSFLPYFKCRSWYERGGRRAGYRYCS